MKKVFVYLSVVVFAMMFSINLDAMEPCAKRTKFESAFQGSLSEQEPPKVDPLEIFHDWVWGEIFSNLSPRDLARVSRCCKCFKQIAANTQIDGMDGEPVKFCDIRKKMNEMIAAFPASKEKLDEIDFRYADYLFEKVASFFELIVSMEIWCELHFMNLEMFNHEMDSIKNMLSTYEAYAHKSDYFDPDVDFDYFNRVIAAAIRNDQPLAIDMALRYYNDGVLVNRNYLDWLGYAIERNSISVIQYLIDLLKDKGENLEVRFNEIGADHGFCMLDKLLINEFICDETIKFFMQNGARAHRILTGDNFAPLREKYFYFLKELGLGQ